MGVVGRADDDGVEPTGVEHLAEVGVGPGHREPVGGAAEEVRVDVADRDDVFPP